jgi:hypothetical protein
MSTPVPNSMAAQMVFDTKRHKYCSTYNLAEGLDKVTNNKIVTEDQHHL